MKNNKKMVLLAVLCTFTLCSLYTVFATDIPRAVVQALKDPITKALVTIDIEHYEIHEGDHYFIGGFETLANPGDTLEFVVTTPASSTHAHMNFVVSANSTLSIYVYEDASGVSGGSTATPINNNRNSTKTSVLNVIKDPATISSDGSLIDSFSFGGTDKFSAHGGLAETEEELLLNSDTTYLWRFTAGDSNVLVSYKGIWYEEG